MFTLSQADRQFLKGVHPDLVKVIERAAEIAPFPFTVTEGLRSMARQKHLKATGFSWTLKSRHLTGHAVDICPKVDVDGNGTISTAERYSWPLYYKLAPVVKQAARDVGVTVEWGGDWKTNKDGPHWQLPWSKYAMSEHQEEQQLAMVDQMGVEEEYHLDPEASPGTEAGSAGRAVGIMAGGMGTGSSIGYQPVADVALQTLTGQQYELTSGDIGRIIIAVVIIGVTAYFAWRAAR